jgi:hypothetical protein
LEGSIYISGVFTTVNRSKCGGAGWLDNDPHFWSQPPTWGICRTDFRRTIREGDYIFFVLPKKSELPQMVYGYFRVQRKMTHTEAYASPALKYKRMGKKNPNGNIIVDANGLYNPLDGDAHKDRFDEIKRYYIVGDENESEFLSEVRIRRLAPEFITVLNSIFETRKDSVFGVVGRGGRKMSEEQVSNLLAWLRA